MKRLILVFSFQGKIGYILTTLRTRVYMMYTINTIRQVKKIKNESKKQAPSPYLELSQSINLIIIIE